jgi:succinyl-CoA synthetase alpha subunit
MSAMLIVGQISSEQEAKEIEFIAKVSAIARIAGRLARQKEN